MENCKHRIKVKIGDSEFDAEGEQSAVQSQFEAFLAAMNAASAAKPTTPPLSSAAPPAVGVVPAPSDPNEYSKVFRQGDPLSLLALPKGKNWEAEALLMLLYGYTKLGAEASVTGTMLMKAARQSGLQLLRVDRIMEGRNKDYVMAAGFKKGRRYSLNNRGIAQAESLMSTLFE